MTTGIKIHPYTFMGLKQMKEFTPEEIIVFYCKVFGMNKQFLLSKVRKTKYCNARSVISNILRNEKNYTLVSISKLLNRDHSTIIWAIRRHDDLMQYDLVYKENYTMFLDYILYGKTFEIKKYPTKTIAETNGYECINHHKNRNK